MIDLLRRNPWIGALALIAAALAVIVAFELAGDRGSASRAAPPRGAAGAESKLLPPIVALAPEQAYPETSARPLWIPTRRPAPAVVAASASFARGQFILQGVTIAGDTRIAMLREKASGRVHRVEKGRDVNGIQVAEIEPEKVTLAQGGEREVLELRVQRPGGAPGATAPGPASAMQGPFAGAPAPAPPPVPGGASAASPAFAPP